MIKKLISITFLSIVFFSCTNGDENPKPVLTENCNIRSVKTKTLLFDDIALDGYNESFPETIAFEYDDLQRIVSVRGGLKATGGIDTLMHWTLFQEVNDTITYDNNVISVKYSNNVSPRPYDKEFVISGNQLLNRKVTSYNSPFSVNPVTYTYEYNSTGIIEKINNVVYRTFTIENGNLVKVEHLAYNSANAIVLKEEYLFSNYDNSDNLLKGKYYINGAFFKAFSNNNYKSYVYNKYLVENGNYKLEKQYSLNIDFVNGPQNFPDLFTRNCN